MSVENDVVEENVEFFEVRCERAYQYESGLIGEYGINVRCMLSAAIMIAFRGSPRSSDDSFSYEIEGDNGSLIIECSAELSDEQLVLVKPVVDEIIELIAECDGLELVESVVEFFCVGVSGELEGVEPVAVSLFLEIMSDTESVWF